MFGFLKSPKESIEAAFMEKMLQKILTPETFQGILDNGKAKAAALRQKHGGPVMATIGQDEETGNFVFALYKAAGEDWEEVSSKAIATGADLHTIIMNLIMAEQAAENENFTPETVPLTSAGAANNTTAGAAAEPGAAGSATTSPAATSTFGAAAEREFGAEIG